MAPLIGFILGLASASLTAERWSEVAGAVDELLLCGGFLLPLSPRSGTAGDMLGTPQPQTVCDQTGRYRQLVSCKGDAPSAQRQWLLSVY